MKSYTSRTLKLMTMLCLSLIIFGCGGGGSSSTPSASTTAVSGTVLAGPANGAVVIVKSAGVEVARSGGSAADGSFKVTIPTSELSKDLIFEATGGTFPDEATSTTGVAMGTFSVHVSGGTLTVGSNVTIDPSSTIVQKMVAGGKTKAAAETVFATAFGYTPDCSIKPAFATISSASTTSQRLAGLRAAAFSQLTKDLGLTPAKQFELIQALADDLSDGVLDGLKTGGTTVTTASGTAIPVDIANCFAKALMTFQTSDLNKCKLTTDKIGAPPFATKALTASYVVEYVPDTMTAAMGKTTFKIKVTNRGNSSAASGKTVTLRPYMYMAAKSHTTPMEIPIDNGDGTYSCTVYYVMPSAMNGVSMGVWELKVKVDNLDAETATFYPVVGMPMGNDMLTKLSGISDSIMGMAGTEKRTWFLFNDGLMGGMGGSHTFKLFLATKENGMTLSFPAVTVGSSLKNESNIAWTVSSIAVDVSTDKITWVPAADLGNGHWSAAGLNGLTVGTAGKIHVRLTVSNGVIPEQKSTDGLAVGATNGYQTFNVTPM
ncbi:MAG: hypothetical protein H7X83_07170 [Verrucomicrobia bacterium]|nr:hypothetical protein [Deltaproteobacteria bacterium]